MYVQDRGTCPCHSRDKSQEKCIQIMTNLRNGPESMFRPMQSAIAFPKTITHYFLTAFHKFYSHSSRTYRTRNNTVRTGRHPMRCDAWYNINRFKIKYFTISYAVQADAETVRTMELP